jgi:EAL and modified HD-GYP domain-containing signal transduction protein
VSKSIPIEPPVASTDASALRPVVSRQPICDRYQRTFAYEVLFREFDTEKCVFGGENEATSRVVFNSIVEIGLGRLVGPSMAFVNFSRDFILSRNCSLLPRNRVVLEILESSAPDPKFLAGLAMLRMKGFRFAVDGFNFQKELMPFLPHCSFIKVDLRLVNRDRLIREIPSLRSVTASMLAENVETVEEFESCRELGFQYFQGYFFCRPRIASTATVSTNRRTLCGLLSRLQQPDVTTREIEAIMDEDPALSSRLQRCINSAAIGMPRKIQSIQHAIRMVGLDHFRILSSMVVLSSLDDKPRELTRTSVIRARMCQILGEGPSRHYGSFFTTGLFSTLEAFLDCSMEKAIAQVPLSDEIRNALLHKKGPKGRMLAAVIAYEQGDWDALIQMRIDPEKIAKAYLDSVAWGEELLH